jgi:ribosome-associated translation inhibitor RaiA
MEKKDVEKIKEILEENFSVPCAVEVKRIKFPFRTNLRINVFVPLGEATDIEVLKTDFKTSIDRAINVLEKNYKVKVVGPITCETV